LFIRDFCLSWPPILVHFSWAFVTCPLQIARLWIYTPGPASLPLLQESPKLRFVILSSAAEDSGWISFMLSNCRPFNSNFISYRFSSLLTLERKPLSFLTCCYGSLYTGSRFCFWSSFCTLRTNVATFTLCSNLWFHCFGVYCMTGLKYSDTSANEDNPFRNHIR